MALVFSCHLVPVRFSAVLTRGIFVVLTSLQTMNANGHTLGYVDMDPKRKVVSLKLLYMYGGGGRAAEKSTYNNGLYVCLSCLPPYPQSCFNLISVCWFLTMGIMCACEK